MLIHEKREHRKAPCSLLVLFNSQRPRKVQRKLSELLAVTISQWPRKVQRKLSELRDVITSDDLEHLILQLHQGQKAGLDIVLLTNDRVDFPMTEKSKKKAKRTTSRYNFPIAKKSKEYIYLARVVNP